MPDLIVRLYDLPPLAPALGHIHAAGFQIRHAMVPEKHLITRWVGEKFSPAWASECEVTFARQPVSCFVAIKEQTLCGFVAFEATCRNFLGPLGVGEEFRATGLGAGLLLTGLHAMYREGYAYAIIGGAGPVDFFQKVAGAIPIPQSTPGIYQGMLREHGVEKSRENQ